MDDVNRNILGKILLLIVWASFYFSINLNPSDFFELGIISQLRLSLPLGLVILLLLLKKREFKLLSLNNYYVFLFYSIFFLYSFFTVLNKSNDPVNIYWPLYMFLSFFIFQNFTNLSEKKLLLKISIIIISLVFIIFVFFGIKKVLMSSGPMHFYGISGWVEYIDVENPPRSSGLARYALIIFSFIMSYYLINNKIKNYFLLTLLSVSGIFALIFQSRTISFIYFVFMAFVAILYFKKFFKDKRLIIFSFIIPFIINICYNYYLLNASEKYKKNIDKEYKINLAIKNILLRKSDLYSMTNDEFSSNRFENWEKAIQVIKKNYFLGYGAQADRLLINQSIHNSILYATLSGGIIGGISIILIYLYSILILIKFYFSNAVKNKNDFIAHYSAFVLVIVSLRSILETSFAVFSIDYLIYISAFLYLVNLVEKKHSNTS